MRSCPSPCVIWITGIAGAGKTTIAARFAERLRAGAVSVVLLDGDELRSSLVDQVGYSIEERERLAFIYARLCKLIASQGHTVICATISLFHSVHEWNREHQPGYVEIHVRAPIALCRTRGREALYALEAGEHVVGREIAAEEPRFPDLVLDNDEDASIDELVTGILDYLETRERGRHARAN